MTREWLAQCLSVAGTAAIPISEIFAAVPLGLALGLDPVSIVVSATVGNLAVAVVLHLLYDVMQRSPRLRAALERAQSGRTAERMARAGNRILLLFTPIIGIYLSTVISRGLGMPAGRTFPIKLFSVAVYCAAMVLAAALPWPTPWAAAAIDPVDEKSAVEGPRTFEPTPED